MGELGQTPLSYATNSGHEAVAKLFQNPSQYERKMGSATRTTFAVFAFRHLYGPDHQIGHHLSSSGSSLRFCNSGQRTASGQDIEKLILEELFPDFCSAWLGFFRYRD